MQEVNLILILSNILIDIINVAYMQIKRLETNSNLNNALKDNGYKVIKKYRNKLDKILSNYLNTDFCNYDVKLLVRLIMSVAPIMNIIELYKNSTGKEEFDTSDYSKRLELSCYYKDIQNALKKHNIVEKDEERI